MNYDLVFTLCKMRVLRDGVLIASAVPAVPAVPAAATVATSGNIRHN
jgi:hypothetical protein